MKNNKRIIALSLGILLFVSLLTACGGSQQDPETTQASAAATTAATTAAGAASTTVATSAAETQAGDNLNPPGTLPIVKEKVNISIFANQRNVIDYPTNDFTNWLEDRTNVHLEWEVIATDYNEKMNLMLASGTYTDIIMSGGGNPAAIEKYAPQGVIIPVNDLIDKYCVRLNAALDEMPEARGLITHLDGNIYGFPDYNSCFHCEYNQKLWINIKWLDALGLAIPTTTEEFYDVMKAFKENDPNGNGIADEIPLSGSIGGWASVIDGFLSNPFIFHTGRSYEDIKLYFSVADGKVLSAANQDGYRDALIYLNRLCSEGLLDRNAFSNSYDQMRALANDPADIIGAFPSGSMGLEVEYLNNNERYKEYAVIPPLAGPDGTKQAPHWPSLIGKEAVIVTDKCEYPEVVARWYDEFLDAETALSRQTGIPGRDWRWADTGEIGVDGNQAYWAYINMESDEPQNYCWQNACGPIWWPLQNRAGLIVPPGSDPYDVDQVETLLHRETLKLAQHNVEDKFKTVSRGQLLFTDQESTEISFIEVELQRYIAVSIAQFITGELSVENDWDAYVQNLEALGLPDYLSFMQTAYDRQK